MIDPSTLNSPFTKFSPTAGDWVLYLLMGVLAEYIAVLIYVVAGTRTPLERDMQTDYARSATLDYEEERYRLTASGNRVPKEIDPWRV